MYSGWNWLPIKNGCIFCFNSTISGNFLSGDRPEKIRPLSRYYFSEWEETDETSEEGRDLINKFFLNYVYDGIYKGRKQIYNKENLSLLTGQTKSEILEEIKTFTLVHRKSFETLVNKSNIFTPQHSEEEYNILETLNRIRDSNDLLKNDTEFITFMNEFTTYINTQQPYKYIWIIKIPMAYEEYMYEFKNDTLVAVYRGRNNYNRPIDYSNYPNSNPKWNSYIHS